MNIVLVSIGNFQEYILVNIKQLLLLKHKSIFVITDKCFFDKFHGFQNDIKLIASETLNVVYIAGKNIDTFFRNGFWELTSKRLFYVQLFMKEYKIQDVIHLENDVLIYYNCDLLLDTLDRNKICFPVDTSYRAIASIMYIPNSDIFGRILSHYNPNASDMQNLSLIQRMLPYLFDNFPICFQEKHFNEEQKHVTRLYGKYGDMIFDAAAIGQMLGGIDPRNSVNGESTIGYVSPQCAIKYDNYVIVWQQDKENIKRPFL